MSITLNGTTGIVAANISTTTSTLGPLTQALNLGATGQIKFPAVQNASADANTLDDYEEGTYTCSLIGITNGASIQSVGRYIKIGGVVTCFIDFYNRNITGLVGHLRVTVPFAGQTTHGVVSITASNFDVAMGELPNTATHFSLYRDGNGAADFSQLTQADWSNPAAATIRATYTYLAS